MQHITFLALMIVSMCFSHNLNAQGLVILGCPQDSFVLCAPNPSFLLPDNNKMIVGESDPNATSCSGHMRLPLSISDDCGIILTYFVDFYPFDQGNMIRLQDTAQAFLNAQDESTLVLDTKLYGVGDVSLNGIDYNEVCPSDPGGFHRLVWTVFDECGNQAVCDYLIRLEDCVPPLVTPIGLSNVPLPTDGTVNLWASDFVGLVVDDCSPINWMLYSFDEEIFTPNFVMDCNALCENDGPTFLFDIWTADGGVDRNCDGTISWNERNLTQTATIIVVENGNNVCDDCLHDFSSGTVKSAGGAPIADATVAFLADMGQFATVQTNDEGAFSNPFINPFVPFTLSVSKGGDDGIGVSTLDLIKIQKHLLGLETFDSPYKHIAGDVNGNGTVSAADLLELQKLILTIYDSFPKNKSWRFIPESFQFAGPDNPWPFDESIHTSEAENLNFIGVKVGDLNGSVTQQPPRTRENPIELTVGNKEFNAGELIEIDFTCSNFNSVLGFQYTLNTKGLEIIDIIPGVIDLSNQNTAKQNEYLTFSWHNILGVSVNKSDVLFTITATANQSGSLAETLEMNSHHTLAESYIKGTDSVSEIHLRISEEIEKTFGTFLLFQNEPNPFNHNTSIPFEINTPGQVSLRVFNILGREMYFSSQDFLAGRNAFPLNFFGNGERGLMYYQVSMGDITLTKKMLIL